MAVRRCYQCRTFLDEKEPHEENRCTPARSDTSNPNLPQNEPGVPTKDATPQEASPSTEDLDLDTELNDLPPLVPQPSGFSSALSTEDQTAENPAGNTLRRRGGKVWQKKTPPKLTARRETKERPVLAARKSFVPNDNWKAIFVKAGFPERNEATQR